MNIEDQVAALFARANPVPSLDLLDPIAPVDIGPVRYVSERSKEMSQVDTIDDNRERHRSHRSGLLVATGVVAAVIAIGIGVFTAIRPDVATTSVDRATAFWVAVSEGDRAAAIEQLDPTQIENGIANIFGRAHTIEGQFDWYEAVGFEWVLDNCVETGEDAIECTVYGRNAWSDAIGVEPVPGTFYMDFGRRGITNILEKRESFRSQWLPQVYDIFNRWVLTHYPEDAPVMWNESDITPEGLELFAINTARFVASYPTED
ncbi:MAG TPA: hypothetical protein VJ938_14150 [Acidimicrobiia bacterium]|nr:hypothetical protein [Acidimicrobiia bacterium]